MSRAQLTTRVAVGRAPFPRRLASALALAALACATVAGVAMANAADSVADGARVRVGAIQVVGGVPATGDPADAQPTPTPPDDSTAAPHVVTGDTTCQDSYPNDWLLDIQQAELDPALATGTGHFSDGTLNVDLANYDGSTFDWTSNLGVDGVWVSTSTGGTGYDYHGGTSGSDLTAGAQIDELTFCYDHNQAGPTPGTEEQGPAATPKLPDTAVIPATLINHDDNSLPPAVLLAMLGIVVVLGSAALVASRGLFAPARGTNAAVGPRVATQPSAEAAAPAAPTDVSPWSTAEPTHDPSSPWRRTR